MYFSFPTFPQIMVMKILASVDGIFFSLLLGMNGDEICLAERVKEYGHFVLFISIFVVW